MTKNNALTVKVSEKLKEKNTNNPEFAQNCKFRIFSRVYMCQGNVREFFFSKSGNCQGILLYVRVKMKVHTSAV